MFRRPKTPENTPRQPLRSVGQRRPADVFAYHALRDTREDMTARQPELLQERQRESTRPMRRRVQAIFLLVVLLMAFAYLTWLSNTPHITVLGSANDRALLQNTATYQQAAQKLLSDSIGNHSKLTLDTNAVASKLEQQFPELLSVSVQPPLIGTQPQIYIQPDAPVLRLATNSGSVYVLSISGKALAPVGQISQTVALDLPLITDQSGLSVSTGKSALPSSDVSFIQAVLGQLRAQHLTTNGMTLPNGTSELDVHLNGKPYFVKFNLEADPGQQVGTYLALNKYLLQHNVTPSQYVDVRVLGRAYYK